MKATCRAFDFANHFIEWVLDYSHPQPPYFTYTPEHFPTAAQQRDDPLSLGQMRTQPRQRRGMQRKAFHAVQRPAQPVGSQ